MININELVDFQLISSCKFPRKNVMLFQLFGQLFSASNITHSVQDSRTIKHGGKPRNVLLLALLIP